MPELARVEKDRGAAAPALPRDATLLPLAAGQLLVSRDHATFCRVPPDDVEAVRRVLAGEAGLAALGEALREDLDRHGFLGPPREAKPASPSVQLQLTNACNLACAYCCTNSGAARQVELGREHFFRIVDDVRENLGPGVRVAILGGEPFLVPWAIDLAEHVLDRELSLAVFSNGLPLVDDDLARRVAGLIARGAQVRISLAGPTAGSCDGVSGTSRFDRAIEGIARVFAHGGRPIVDVMLVPQEVETVASALHELRALLPPGTKITLGILFRGGREQGERLFGSRAALEAALDRIAFEAGERIPATAPSPVAERREGCSCALGHHLHVRSDGALFTCFKMEEKVGDLRSAGFAETLARVRARPRPATVLPLCEACPLATLCGGGCRSENIQLTGDADLPVCGPWRVRVLCELLAEDRVSALEWPAEHLLDEARRRGIDAPAALRPAAPSLHLVET